MKKPEPPAEVCCSTMQHALRDERFAIAYDPVTREIHLVGIGHRLWIMKHCCWCGAALARSLGSLWYRRMRQLGATDADGYVVRRRVPREYRSDAWWRACAAEGGRGDAIDADRAVGKRVRSGQRRRANRTD